MGVVVKLHCLGLSERHGCYWPPAMFTRHGRIIIQIASLFYRDRLTSAETEQLKILHTNKTVS